MKRLRGLAVAVLVLGGLVVALLGGCRSRPGPAEPPGPAPKPVGPMPGQGCRNVALEPPCTLSYFGPGPARAKVGMETVSYLVRYKDSKGREVTPYWLEARRADRSALEKFFQEHRVVQCQGGWTSAPCNDTPRLEGFPEPSVGTVVLRGR